MKRISCGPPEDNGGSRTTLSNRGLWLDHAATGRAKVGVSDRLTAEWINPRPLSGSLGLDHLSPRPLRQVHAVSTPPHTPRALIGSVCALGQFFVQP
jgi:hypothetical protein